MLVGDKMHLHTLLVFFAVVGGIMLFGAAGLILGPVAVVVTNTLIKAWQRSSVEDSD
jgi:predicted PurR-regulated permease PerM